VRWRRTARLPARSSLTGAQPCGVRTASEPLASGVFAAGADTATVRELWSTSRRAARAGANVRPISPAPGSPTRTPQHGCSALPPRCGAGHGCSHGCPSASGHRRSTLLEPLAQQLTVQTFCKMTFSPKGGRLSHSSACRTLKITMSASRTTRTFPAAVSCARTAGGAALSGSTRGQLADRGRRPSRDHGTVHESRDLLRGSPYAASLFVKPF